MKPGILRLGPVVLAASALVVTGCGGDPIATRGPARASPPPAREQAPDAAPHPRPRPADHRAGRPEGAAHRARRLARLARGRGRAGHAVHAHDVRRAATCSRAISRTGSSLQVIGGRLGDMVVDSPVQAFARSHRYILFLGPDGPVGPTIFPQAVLEVEHRRADRAWLTRIRRYL